MSKYSKNPLDLSGLKTIRLADRGGKVKTTDFAAVYQQGSGVAGWVDSLPHILAGDAFRGILAALAQARQSGRAILWALGGHVIKCGLAPVLVDLMRRGYVTAFVLNGSAAIHDFEIALAGHTSEDVESVLPDGRFGSAEETGREMACALTPELGMGEALGKRLQDAQHAEFSLLAQTYAASIPVTVHVAI